MLRMLVWWMENSDGDGADRAFLTIDAPGFGTVAGYWESDWPAPSHALTKTWAKNQEVIMEWMKLSEAEGYTMSHEPRTLAVPLPTGIDSGTLMKWFQSDVRPRVLLVRAGS